MLRLPEELRGELKEPFGPVYADVDALMAAAGRPLVAVGDVVTYHLRRAGVEPDVAVVDERTERQAVTERVRRVAAADPDVTVTNEPGTLSRELLSGLAAAVAAPEPTVVLVEGEEDLATLPAVLLAPDGGSVVYGQPGEGMVLVTVDDRVRGRMADLLGRMDGDATAALDLLA